MTGDDALDERHQAAKSTPGPASRRWFERARRHLDGVATLLIKADRAGDEVFDQLLGRLDGLGLLPARRLGLIIDENRQAQTLEHTALPNDHLGGFVDP